MPKAMRASPPPCTDRTGYVSLMTSHATSIGPSTFMAKNGSFGASLEERHAKQVQLLVALSRSLRQVELCRRDFVVLLGTQVPLSFAKQDRLKQEGMIIHPAPPLIPGVPTADKLLVWKLTNYTQLAVIDADVMFLRPIDALFDRDDEFTIAHHPYDHLQAQCGVSVASRGIAALFVMRPSLATYDSLMSYLLRRFRADQLLYSDQTGLMCFFGNRSRTLPCPFVYDVSMTFREWLPKCPPPSHPPVPPPAASIVDALNKRFFEGGKTSSASLHKAGVLIHHFDNQGNSDKPWLPCPEMCYGQECWCAKTRDRLSASILNAQLPRKGGKMPIYTDVNINAASGFVLNPSFTRVLCVYPYDGGTAQRTCDPVGMDFQFCTPGCFALDSAGGGKDWCDEGGGQTCAFKPEHMSDMLEAQRNVGLSGGMPVYNEVVVDMADWVNWQPRSIEAVWFLRSWNCFQGGSMLCESKARQVHSQLLHKHGLTSKELPLITFDPNNWDAPFAAS